MRLKSWLSLTAVGLNQQERRDLSEQIVSVLTNAGLRLVSIRQAENLGPAERLLRGEALYMESDAVNFVLAVRRYMETAPSITAA
jgi:hypothetical protein